MNSVHRKLFNPLEKNPDLLFSCKTVIHFFTKVCVKTDLQSIFFISASSLGFF